MMSPFLHDHDTESPRLFIPTSAQDMRDLAYLRRLIADGRSDLVIVHVDLNEYKPITQEKPCPSSPQRPGRTSSRKS